MIALHALGWDDLHRDTRHRLEYPSEHVVRWLSGLRRGALLDIGSGSGRHLSAAWEMGFTHSMGVDNSPEANRTLMATVVTADMTCLPFTHELFDYALSYGVFYYGTKAEHRAAIAEMHRVLRPGGRALVCIRRDDDWRSNYTYFRGRQDGRFHCEGEPEDGMPMHFLTEYEVRTYYASFSKLELNWTKTTRGPRCDSDWLIQLTK